VLFRSFVFVTIIVTLLQPASTVQPLLCALFFILFHSLQSTHRLYLELLLIFFFIFHFFASNLEMEVKQHHFCMRCVLLILLWVWWTMLCCTDINDLSDIWVYKQGFIVHTYSTYIHVEITNSLHFDCSVICCKYNLQFSGQSLVWKVILSVQESVTLCYMYLI